MTIVIAILLLALLVGGIAMLFLRADPARLAGSFRQVVPAVALMCGIAFSVAGRIGIGIPIAFVALCWYVMRRRLRWPKPPARRYSMVRTAALEMELDHDTGALEGLVLAGRREGRMLGAMSRAELSALYRELSSDAESRQLLEAYLDSRFPAWRGDLQAHGGERLGVAPGAGAMTKEEAYKILGLETGAAAADVRKAHRRLMQRLHPDIDRASFLAARIDKAKDVLLSDHG
jgi:hypothetical protein